MSATAIHSIFCDCEGPHLTQRQDFILPGTPVIPQEPGAHNCDHWVGQEPEAAGARHEAIECGWRRIVREGWYCRPCLHHRAIAAPAGPVEGAGQ